MLARLIYHSENHLGSIGGKMIADLNAIMDSSNANNARSGITGALLFDTLWFLQVLEGEREALSETLLRIAGDERHAQVTIMDAQPISERSFGNWWMGLAILRDGESDILARHGLGPRFNPRAMSGDQAMSLAKDLAGVGLNRRLANASA